MMLACINLDHDNCVYHRIPANLNLGYLLILWQVELGTIWIKLAPAVIWKKSPVLTACNFFISIGIDPETYTLNGAYLITMYFFRVLNWQRAYQNLLYSHRWEDVRLIKHIQIVIVYNIFMLATSVELTNLIRIFEAILHNLLKQFVCISLSL